MKRVLLTAVLLLAAFFLGRMAYVAMASDETRIQWLLQDEAAAFNDSAMLTVLDSFAPEYRDETASISRDELRAGLRYVFQSRRDPDSKRFLFRAELPVEDLEVQVDGETAQAVFPLRLHEGLDDAETMVWELRVTADLERQAGEWQVVRSRHETLQGAPPGR